MKVLRRANEVKAAKDFDVHKELNNRTFIKPLPSNGKLVRNNLFDISIICSSVNKEDPKVSISIEIGFVKPIA